MKIHISHLTRRSNGAVARRDSEAEAPILKIGRSTQCEVQLSDLRVSFEEATISNEDGRLVMRATGDRRFTVGGGESAAIALTAGTTITLGPYELVAEDPPEGFDVALTIELKVPVGDDDKRVRRAARLELGGPVLNRRRLAWFGFVAVALIFLIMPITQFLGIPGAAPGKEYRVWPAAFDVAWTSGEISNAHKTFATQCTVCHSEAFAMTKNEDCTGCHKTTGHHADPQTAFMHGLADARCGDCHREHQGPRGIIAYADDERLCADCHVGLKARLSSTTLVDAGPFGDAHPEFRVTLIDQSGGLPAPIRVSLADKARLKDGSGLIFPHDKHLNPAGVIAPEGRRPMSCGSCHAPEPGGGGMAPIQMEAHCGDCHRLRFEPRRPDRALPHGTLPWAVQQVRDFYGAAALQGGFDDADAPAVVRRRPGTPLPEEARAEALAWAAARSQAAIDYLASYSVCGTCHEVTRAPNTPEGYQVRPVRLLDEFMPKARFSHGKHADMSCGDCHEAAKSSSSADVLMPDIASCQACHGGQQSAGKVPSTCVDCHVFHRHDTPPMKTDARAAAVAGPFQVAFRRVTGREDR